MSAFFAIQQLILHRSGGAPKIVAQSGTLDFASEEALLKMAVLFGERPTGVACNCAIFARPLGKSRVVVRVADRLDGSLAFHILILSRELYSVLGDPFAISDCFPVNFEARGAIPELAWNPEWLPPRRDVKELLKQLKAGDSPLLLGTTQALLDGAHIAIARPAPDPVLVRTVWQLLPDKVRNELWPATFAFGNDLNFDLAIVPKEQPGFLTQEQAKDYPEGRYELNLQIAIESEDQRELDRLLTRRSSKEVLRMAAMMLLLVFVATAILRFL
jgi:hypothetical protein